VLLVDANNVHPKLHTFFPEGFDRGLGLTSLEEGAAILDRIVFSERDNLFILPSSGDLPAGARSDETVGRFLTILRNLFDIVLFDVPSFERGGKTMLSFLGKLDVAVILARATITDLEEVLGERDKLRHAGALSVATILVQR
jgi:MinD-like ATPase involved in chromosome partitioning or flagellar assembly